MLRQLFESVGWLRAERVEAPPTAFSPSRPLHDASFQDSTYEESISFLDKHCTDWQIDYSTLSALSPSQPSIQIMRLKDDFVNRSGTPIPVMRVVGYFPGVLPATLFALLTHREHRLSWDFNYRMFESFPGDVFPGKPPPEAPLPEDQAFPIDKAKMRRQQLGSGWWAHRVGSAFLSRLGVEDRFFFYRRWCFQHFYDTTRDIPMFSVAFDGCNCDLRRALNVLSPALKSWRAAHEANMPSAVNAVMHYQHISLIPIADTQKQIADNATPLQRLAEIGSFTSPVGCEIMQSFYDETCSLLEPHKPQVEEAIRRRGGTIFTITSINDVGLSKSLPIWAQRRISSIATERVYAALYRAALKRTSLHFPLPDNSQADWR